MRALVCSGPGAIDALRVGELETPALGADGVRIAVRAAGVNFADILLARGEYQEKPAYPFAPGLEASGTVLEVAPGVERCRPGDRVMAFLDPHLAGGGFAEQAVAREDDVAVLPPGMPFEVAAAFPVAYATSHLALRHRARLQPGEVLLVHGASGGVGLTAVEVGRALGATVVASAGGPEKLAIAREHGADEVIDYRSEDIRERVLALTEGADVVYDPVGGDTFMASLRCIRPGGRLLVIGFAGGEVQQIPANHLLVKDASALGLSLGQLRRHRPEVVAGAMDELMRWYAEGRLRPLVSHTFPLDRAVDALRVLEQRRATGKVVVVVSERD